MNRYAIIILLILGPFFLKGQESVRLEGRVLSSSNDVTAVHVSNLTKNKGTITDFDGYFEISVQLGDSLVFSAVQFRRKEMVVTLEILDSPLFLVPLEDLITQLNEVVVMPFNLSGELSRDVSGLQIGFLKTAATENLPNANVITLTQSQRKLFAATFWDCDCVGIKLDPLMNYFSGRTKMLNARIAREERANLTTEVRKYYSDSLYIKELKIPKKNIDSFIYFCELDSSFAPLVKEKNKLKIWEFMRKTSLVYRKNNKVD